MPIGGAISNFPTGFANGINVRGIPLLQAQTGNVYWLDNSAVPAAPGTQGRVAGSDNNRGTYQRPFSTLVGAMAACLPGNGDIIYASTVFEGVYRSLDGGVTWKHLNIGSPSSLIMRVRIAPGYPVRVFLITLKDGIYRLVDEEIPEDAIQR